MGSGSSQHGANGTHQVQEAPHNYMSASRLPTGGVQGNSSLPAPAPHGQLGPEVTDCRHRRTAQCYHSGPLLVCGEEWGLLLWRKVAVPHLLPTVKCSHTVGGR